MLANVKGKPVAAKELPMEITGDPQLGLTDLLGGGGRYLRGLAEIESEVERLGHLDLAKHLKQHVYELSMLQSRLMSKLDEQAELLERALTIISDAIMHGMPITKEVAAVRNEIVGMK